MRRALVFTEGRQALILDGVLRAGGRIGPDPRPILDQAYLIKRSHDTPKKGIKFIYHDFRNGEESKAPQPVCPPTAVATVRSVLLSRSCVGWDHCRRAQRFGGANSPHRCCSERCSAPCLHEARFCLSTLQICQPRAIARSLGSPHTDHDRPDNKQPTAQDTSTPAPTN